MKMKRISTYFALFLAGTIISAILSGCASTRIKHLDAKEFVESAKMIEQMNSAMWMTYLGTSQGRAYLEHQDMLTLTGNPKTVVFWTELDALPNHLAEQLRGGKPPWVPWLKANKTDERTIEPTVPK